MRSFSGFSADEVWRQAVEALFSHPDYKHDGRNGETLEILACGLRVINPRLRWILSRRPPYNPAFGLVEFIWILAGKDESLVPTFWNPILPKFSGKGDHFYGAYGYRLRQNLGIDQIKRAYEALKNAPETRQVVMQIWDGKKDLPHSTGEARAADIPCNLISLLKVRDNTLHWTQIMRSNDIIRGLPYNFIQFTMLHEVFASWLGCEIGEYFHLSDSMHVYASDLSKFESESNEKMFDKTVPRFDMSFEDTEKEIALIYFDLERVARGEVQTETDLRNIFSKTDSPTQAARGIFLQDIVSIIGSDAARRLRHSALAEELIDSCVDERLQLVARLWHDSQKK